MITKKYVLNFDNYFNIICLFVSTLFHAFSNILRRGSIEFIQLPRRVHGPRKVMVLDVPTSESVYYAISISYIDLLRLVLFI